MLALHASITRSTSKLRVVVQLVEKHVGAGSASVSEFARICREIYALDELVGTDPSLKLQRNVYRRTVFTCFRWTRPPWR